MKQKEEKSEAKKRDLHLFAENVMGRSIILLFCTSFACVNNEKCFNL